MLATQMIAAHDAALMFLNRATLENQNTETINANVLRATRLMQVFGEQLEAMQKLMGKATQGLFDGSIQRYRILPIIR